METMVEFLLTVTGVVMFGLGFLAGYVTARRKEWERRRRVLELLDRMP